MNKILKNIRKEYSSSKLKTTDNINIVVGNVWSKINGELDREIINRIDDKLSYFVQGAWFSKLYKDGIWDGYIRFFNKKTRIFPTGFLGDTEKILKNSNKKFSVVDKREKIKHDANILEKVFSSNQNIVPRLYQKKAVMSVAKNSCGVITIPTGTGKTIVINYVIKLIDISSNKKRKHLIITHGTSLLSQLKDEIEKFQNEEIGYIAEGMWNEKRITVASVDSLFGLLQNPYKLRKTKIKKTKEEISDKVRSKKELLEKTENFLLSIDALYCDEAHHSPAKTFKTVINKISNASFRLGFTATYDRKGENETNLKSVTGKILYKKSISWMINKGYLAKPTIILIEYKGKDIEEQDHWSKDYSSGISANKPRNIMLANIVEKCIDKNLSSVVFVVKKEHGDNILNLLNSRHDNEIKYLTGKDSQDAVRKPVMKSFVNGEIRSLLCTRIFNEGMDFPQANCGIRCGAQEYKGGIIQQLGRILRKVKSPISKDIDRKEVQRVFWFDILDVHSRILAKHSLSRIETYESEKEFEVIYSSIKEIERIINERIKEVKIIKKKTSKKNNKNSSKKR
uniref:Putative type III restriction enzyme n=1 Tax=viral metagenome TaxID=1070528 RepID=A0A6M3IHB7_9ZZZZ